MLSCAPSDLCSGRVKTHTKGLGHGRVDFLLFIGYSAVRGARHYGPGRPSPNDMKSRLNSGPPLEHSLLSNCLDAVMFPR